MPTGYTSSERAALIASGVVAKYLPAIIRQAEAEDYPLWDALVKQTKKTNTKSTTAKVSFHDPTSARVAAIGAPLTRGIATDTAEFDITLTKKRINSPLSLLDEDIDSLGDYNDVAEYVVNYTQRSMRGHMKLVRHWVMYDDPSLPGYLFKIEDAAAVYAAGDPIKIKTTPGVRRQIHVSMPVDIHEPGNSTATLAGTVVTYYDPEAAGGPVIKLHDALTIPAGGLLEVYSQSGYGLGLSDPLVKLVDPLQTTYLGLSNPGWRPTVRDLGGNAMTDDDLVDLAIDLCKKGARQPVAILDRVQHKQLVKVLKAGRVLYTEGPNLIGGFGGISINLGTDRPKLIVFQDDEWPIPTRIPMLDFKDLHLEHNGESIAYMPEHGGYKVGTGYYVFNPATSNQLVGDIDSRLSVWAEHRCFHGCLDNVDDTP